MSSHKKLWECVEALLQHLTPAQIPGMSFQSHTMLQQRVCDASRDAYIIHYCTLQTGQVEAEKGLPHFQTHFSITTKQGLPINTTEKENLRKAEGNTTDLFCSLLLLRNNFPRYNYSIVTALVKLYHRIFNCALGSRKLNSNQP